MPDNKLEKLYTTVSKVGLTDKDKDSFLKEYGSNKESQAKLYQTLKKVGLTDKDQSSFDKEYFQTITPQETPTESKGVQATGENSEFPSPFISGDFSSDLQQSEKELPTTNLSDDSLSLYEKYKSIIGGTVSSTQEAEVQKKLKGDFSNRSRARNISTKRRAELKQESFDDYLKTNTASARKEELLESYKDKNRREFLAALSPEDKAELDSTIEQNFSSLKEANKIKVAETEVQTKYLTTLSKQAEGILAKGEENITEEDKLQLVELHAKYSDIYSDYEGNLGGIAKDQEDLSSFEQEKDMLNRTTSQMSNLNHKAFESVFRFLQNSANFVGELPMGATDIPLKTMLGIEADQDVAPVFREIADGYSNIQKPNLDFNAIESPADFFAWGVETTASQTGNLLAASTGNPYVTFLGIGSSAGGGKMDELRTSNKAGVTNYSEDQIRQAGLFSFVVEGGTGLVTGGSINAAKRTFKAATKSIGGNTKELTKKALGKQLLKSTGSEVVEETTAQLLDNAFHISVLEDKNRFILDGLAESAAGALFTSGAINSAGTLTPMLIHESTKAVRTTQEKNKFKDNQKKIKEYIDEINSLEEDSELKKVLAPKVKKLQKDNESIIKKNLETLQSINESDVKELSKIDKDLKKLASQRKELKNNDALSKEIAEEVNKDIADKIVAKIEEKNEVIANVGYDKVIRKEAQKAVYDRKIKQFEEAGGKGDKPVISKKDIDKEYDKIIKNNKENKLKSFEETFNPLLDHLEVSAKDMNKDNDFVKKEYIESVQNSDYYKSLDKDAQAALIRNSEETVDRYLQKNKRFEKDSEEGSLKKIYTKIVTGIEQKLVDSLAGAKREISQTYGAKKSKDFIEKTKLYKGITRNKVQDFSKRVSNFIEEIEGTFNLREFDLLMKDLHAEEANAHSSKINENNVGFAGGINVAESKKRLEALSPEQKSSLEKLSKKYQEFVSENRQNLKDTGRIDEETFNAFEDYYENYIDLRGFNNDKIDISNDHNGKKGLSSKGVDNQKRKGRSTESDHVITNLMNAYAKTIEEGQKDIIMQSLETLYEKDSNINPFELYDSGELPLVAKESPDKRVAYFSEGKRKYIVFDKPEFNRAFNQADLMGKSLLARALKSYTGFIKQTITSWSPEFAPTNFLRDTQVAFRSMYSELESNPEFSDVDASKVGKYMSSNIIKGASNVRKVLVGKETGDAKIDQYGKEFLESGAVTGITKASFDDVQKKIKKQAEFYKKGKKARLAKAKEIKDVVALNIEHYNSIFENVHRFNAFVAVREQGVATQTAARLAKDLTVDFDQSGDWGSAASSVYYFFNAAVQGNVRFFKNLYKMKRDKDGNITGLSRAQKGLLALPTFTFMQTALILNLSEEDEDGKTYYEKDPEYLKRNSIRFYTGADDGTVATIPLAYGSNALAYAGVVAAEVVFGTRSAKDGIMNLVGAAVDITSPISVSGSEDNSIIDTLVPSVLQPVEDIATNENFFGSPIHTKKTMFNKDTPDSQKGKKNTPEVFKATAALINEITGGTEFESGKFDAHPESYQYFVESIFGGLSKLGGNVLSTVEGLVDEDKDLKTNKIPFIRKFLHTPSDYTSIREFQDKSVFLGQRVKSLWKDYNKAKESNKIDKAKKLKVEGEKVRKVLDEYELAKKELIKVRKARKELASNTDEEYVKKRSKVLEAYSVKISKRLNGYYNKVLGKTYE